MTRSAAAGGKSWGKGDGASNNKGAGKGKQSSKGKQSGDFGGDRAYAAAVNDVIQKTAMRAVDLDPKAIQLLDALSAAGKANEACAHLATSLEEVPRDKVSNWKAYVFTLLRKYDVDFYQSMKDARGKPNARHHSKEKEDPKIDWVKNAREFVPGQTWTSVKATALTLDGCALEPDGAAASFTCAKAQSPSSQAASKAKDDHRMIRALSIAHAADEDEELNGPKEPSFSRQCSVDSEGVVHGTPTPENKTGSADRLKMFHRKKVARAQSDDQSTVASVDDHGTVHPSPTMKSQEAPLIVPATAEAH